MDEPKWVDGLPANTLKWLEFLERHMVRFVPDKMLAENRERLRSCISFARCFVAEETKE